MSLTDRITGAWSAPLSTRSLDARIQLVPRTSWVLLALLVAATAAGQWHANSRLGAVSAQAYPALLDARQLASTLDAVHAELAHNGAAADHERRLDSLGVRFHAIARRDDGTALRVIEARFGEYMGLSRRAALGLSSADDAGTRASVAAEQSYHALDAAVASNVRDAERVLAGSLDGARRLQSTVMAGLLLGSAFVLLLMAGVGRAVRTSVSAWLDGLTGTIDALAAGEPLVVGRDAAEGAPGRLDDALRRLARQLSDNADAAHALAAGAYRRAARSTAPRDPIGMSLAHLAATMGDVAGAAQRIARGDLDTVLEPQSVEDGFGMAFAAMSLRVTRTLKDVDVTRTVMVSMIEAMRGDAVALASSAGVDADQLRRIDERLTAATLQARADVERSAVMRDRAIEGETMLEAGSHALQSSLDGLQGVLRGANGVQELARRAGMLAVRSTTQVEGSAGGQAGGMHVEAARSLATDAAAAASAMTRLMIDGTDHAYEAGVAFDRVALAVRHAASLARERDELAQRQASALAGIDDTVAQLFRTASNNAETARQIVGRLDALASHAGRLEAVAHRAGTRRGAAIIATDAPMPECSLPHVRLGSATLQVSSS